MITINMLDGEKIEIHPDTVLVGVNNAIRDLNSKNPGASLFYLQQHYVGTLDKDYFTGESSSLATCDERLGIGGFLLSHQLFAIGEGEDKTFYFTSAVKSISVS